VTAELIDTLSQLEPFGSGNPQPILRTAEVSVIGVRRMGDNGQHVKLSTKDATGLKIDLLAFNAADYFFVEVGATINVWYSPEINEWQGRRSVDGKLLQLQASS
jgi:single-stranded-DNA-specific exonuclease